jgi:sugar phosphate isomerase/epimerase
VTPLGLHQITAPGADPLSLISIARQVGCQHVCIFVNTESKTHSTESLPAFPFPVVTHEDKIAVLRRLNEEGIRVGNVEFFPIVPDVNVEGYRGALELAARLGAKRAVAHIYDPDSTRAAENLAVLCDIAAGCDLVVGIEFAGLLPACRSIDRASEFIDLAARANLGIGVDALHLVRTGGDAAQVAALAQRIAYAQICDGIGLHESSNYLAEALHRVIPGQGDFPLIAILRAIPQSVPLDVEVPSANLHAHGSSALDHARFAVEGARRAMAMAGR